MKKKWNWFEHQKISRDLAIGLYLRWKISGDTQTEIAREVGVSPTTISMKFRHIARLIEHDREIGLRGLTIFKYAQTRDEHDGCDPLELVS
jgi:transcriptional regulator